MLAGGAPRYVSERAREWPRAIAYGGIAALFLSILHVSASVVAFTAASFAFTCLWTLIAAHRERHGDKLPARIACRCEERRRFQTYAVLDLVQKWKAELSFEDLVTEAAACGNEFGRRLSVIYVRVPGLRRAAHQPLLDLMRAHVRKTDELKSISEHEFLICAPFLRDVADAEIIINRLVEVTRNFDGAAFASAVVHVGKAVYPMDGYTGVDLVRRALSASRTRPGSSRLALVSTRRERQ